MLPTNEIVKIILIYTPLAGRMITGNLNVISDARVRNIISKGHKYRIPSNIDFLKFSREIAASFNDEKMLNLMP